MERSVGIVQCAQIPEQEKWIVALRGENVYGRNFYAFMAILISQVSNIKSPHLELCLCLATKVSRTNDGVCSALAK